MALGGPVTITALWLNPDVYDQLPDDINDSKKIKPPVGPALLMFCNAAASKLYNFKDVDDIDQHGVVKTALMAIAEAAAGVIEHMAKAGINGPTHALVDGPLLPKQMPCGTQRSFVVTADHYQ